MTDAPVNLDAVERRWKHATATTILDRISADGPGIDESDITHAEARADEAWPESDMAVVVAALADARRHRNVALDAAEDMRHELEAAERELGVLRAQRDAALAVVGPVPGFEPWSDYNRLAADVRAALGVQPEGS
jgi:hypothetical protein